MLKNHNHPLVSVVIPTRNRPKLLVRAIESVLTQTFSNIQCIVVDDASTDNTTETVLAVDDSRILYLRNEVRVKAAASRNRGIKAAKGQYIALLDDDDEWIPDKIEKQVIKFGRVPKQVGVIYSGFCFCSGSEPRIVRNIWPANKGNTYKEIIMSNFVGSPTPLIKRECFKTAGMFDERLPSCQDWDLWIRLAKDHEFDFVDEILAKHFVHGDQISNDLKAKIKARRILLSKYEKEFKKRPFVIGRHLKRLGQLYFLDGKFHRGRNKLFDSLFKNPLQPDIYHHLILSFFPTVYTKVLHKYYLTKIENISLYS